jgi:hypothetical protein
MQVVGVDSVVQALEILKDQRSFSVNSNCIFVD